MQQSMQLMQVYQVMPLPIAQGGSRQYLNYTFSVLPVSLTQFIEYVAFHENFNEITMQFVL